MSSPADLTAAGLAAELRVLADRVESLAPTAPTPGPTPGPTPTPEPDPTPEPEPVTVPQTPTGLAISIGQDLRPILTWDPAPGVDNWDVTDQNNSAKPIQDTVTTPRSVRSPLRPGSPSRAYAVRARNSAGTSAWSAPAAVPVVPDTTTPAPTTTPTTPTTTPTAPSSGAPQYPADLFGKGWYLTLPVAGTKGWAAEVHQPTLATYSSRYCELTPARDGVVFRVWHGGATTSGSPNPRSELRECNADGSLAKWSALTGRHSMEVVGQVNRLTPVRPHLVAAQIHGKSDDITVWRVEGTELWITDGDNTHGHLVTNTFQLGQRYTMRFDVTPAADGKTGRVTFTYNGVEVPYAVTTTDTGNYFKAGNYLQSNVKSAPTESTAQWAETIVFSATVTHG